MKLVIRSILLAFAIIFALISLLIPFTGRQIQKNRLVLADMKDRVGAVREFRNRNSRLPTQDELTQLSTSLPARYHRYEYRISQGRPDDPHAPFDWPSTGGWAVSFWRGEWNEYYTSWNDRYTLSDQLSYRAFWDPLLFAPVLAVAFFALRNHSMLHGNKAGPGDANREQGCG